MSTTCRFEGKVAFRGTNAGQSFYLTRYREPTGHSFIPAMSAARLTDSEKCILYQVQTNPPMMVIQLGSLDYLTLEAELGLIQLSSEFSDAACFEITVAANGQQSWQVVNGSQLSPIFYTVYNPNLPAPILTINGPGEDIFSSFAPQIITPGLDTILSTNNGRSMDFINVDLSGQDLTGVDFTKANFSVANLTNTKFNQAILPNAIFVGATLTGTVFDGATLDQAQFSGTSTVLASVNWGQPKSAVEIDFSGCAARGTQLGESGAVIRFNRAILCYADFTGANLSKLILDDANLTGLIAAGATFTGASLERAKAHGANFVGGIFNNATLNNGQFGSKALLFAFTSNIADYINELNACNGKLVPSDIATVLKATGVDVSQATVTVWITDKSWLLSTGTANYNCLTNADSSQLLVYRYGGVAAAIFTSASLQGSTSSGANFASADMSNVLWHFATADHTDLESTNLAGSFLFETDFTQAQLFGTILSNSVLIQTKFIHAVVAPGLNRVTTSLTNSQLQGADFTNASIRNGNLAGAAVAMPHGVPLFVMSNDYNDDLKSGDLAAVAPVFKTKGYSLGSGASISASASGGWLIDNSANTTPRCIKKFFIDDTLNVYKESNLTTALFSLASKYQSLLNQPKPAQPLIAYFDSQGTPLSDQASISLAAPVWQITNTQDAPVDLPVIYEVIAITQQPDGLHVYGATLWIKNFSAYASDIDFGTTRVLQAAMDIQSICPNGQPKSNQGSYTWEQMMTRPRPA